MNKENQARIIELVKQAKPLILQEMTPRKGYRKRGCRLRYQRRCCRTKLPEGGSWKRISGHCTDC